MSADEQIEVFARELGIDIASVRTRYRAEREKRLRTDGVRQFVRAKTVDPRFEDDPNAGETPDRAPLFDEIDVAIIGAGFGGLLVGAELRKAGVEQIRYIDRAADFGGVWYWNRYPGAACDTAASIYLPLLEELKYTPQRKYAGAPEIFDHCRRIARTFKLYRDVLFRTEVTSIDWDDSDSRWIIRTNRGDSMRARYVVLSTGPFDRPKLAGIPGLETFKGHAFHTSRWDYAYTGGGPEGGLSKLEDKSVGIIGTGATAVQCIPHLAEGARRLYVFQRTPSSIDVRDERDMDPAYFASLPPGWQKRHIENFTALTSGSVIDEDYINDGWTSVIAKAKELAARAASRGHQALSAQLLTPLADLVVMDQIRRRVDEVVTDRATAEALKPWYDRFCKRPCFHDDYLAVFNRPNVTLVDTDGRGVDRMFEKGIVVGGREYELDCLIYSTGYDISSPYAERISFDITGQSGLTLRNKWAGGAATLHGVMTHQFPNLFIMSHVQTGLSLNFAHTISEQARHIAFILNRGLKDRASRIEVTLEAEEAWVREMDAAAAPIADILRECTPSYLNHEGDVSRLNARNSAYGGGALKFFEIISQWRNEGNMRGLRTVR